MIRYQYEIRRDDVDEVVTLLPALPTELPNLVSIEGPNSSGKSTLLNIIALGLFGLKSRTVQDALKLKLSDLAESDHQDLCFSLNIDDPLGNCALSVSKDFGSPEIAVYEVVDNERIPLTYDAFLDRYNLVYDIPDNPTQRLQELTKDLRERQLLVSNRIQQLVFATKTLLHDIEQSFNPKRLAECQRELVAARKVREEIQVQLEMLTNTKLILTRYFHSRFFTEAYRDFQTKRAQIEELEKQLKSYDKQKRGEKRRVQKYQQEALTLLNSMRNAFPTITENLRKLNIQTRDDYLSSWQKSDIKQLLRAPERHYILFDGILAFRSSLQEKSIELRSDARLEEATLLEDLVRVLSRFRALDMSVPGTNKSVREFYDALNSRLRDCKEIKHLFEHYDAVLQQLGNLEKDANTFVSDYLSKVSEMADNDVEEDLESEVDIQHDIERAKKELDNTIRRVKYYRDGLIKSGETEENASRVLKELEGLEELKLYRTYGERQIDDKLANFQSQITSYVSDLKKKEFLISQLEVEEERLKKEEPHKYMKEVDTINNLFKRAQRLQASMSQWDQFVKDIIARRPAAKESNDGKHKYHEAVSVYLARRIGALRHIKEVHTLERVDLIAGKVITTSGKEIRLNDLGTGQSQSAYLLGLLNVSDNRRMIALIDEVAMMDKQSLTPIFETMKAKYKDGSLLAAVVVQKSESLFAQEIL